MQIEGATERTRVQLCGRLSVEIDGAEIVSRLRGRQVRSLLAYLVIHRDRLIGRDELIGALWPETAPRSQDAALRTLLSRLRSAAQDGLLRGRDELTLALPEPAWVDLEAAGAELAAAARALEAGDPRAAWAHAQVPLNIAGRGLLPGANARWLEPHRRDLHRTRLQALEIVGRAGLGLGQAQLSSVERAGRALIESEPYRESGYVLLIEALRRQGNVAEGLRVFEQLRTLLRDELGTAPSPEALAAHRRLLHGGSAASAAPAAEPAPAPSRRAIQLPPELVQLRAPRLVGRGAELSELHRWWSDGGARAMLVAGEAGIGKSRLLAEYAGLAHEHGATVLAGRAPEETVVPFQPLLEALAHYARHGGTARLRADLQGWGPELAQLVPEIGRRLPELEPAVARGGRDPESDRYRLFEAVATLLGAIAADVPLLLVLDDLHWADRPTLQLVRHLVRSPLATGLRILGAYRLGEPLPAALESAAAELGRDELMRTLQLTGLPEPEATELVAQRVGATPPQALMRALYAETEGSPLFLSQLVRHLADSGIAPDRAGPSELYRVGLPHGVRGLISRRLARLGSDTVEWLQVASVIGPEFDAGLLESVLGFEERRFDAALDEALAAGLAIESPVSAGGYRFGHAVIRQTLYESISSHRLGRLHHRIGTELENRGEREVASLALHFTRSGAHGDPDRAVDYAISAGDRASALLAHEEAADHYGRALAVLDRIQPDGDRRTLELLLKVGEALIRAGERPAAWHVFVRAAALADRLGDGEALQRAAIGASWRYLQPPGVVDQELIGLLDRALLATAGQRSATRVLLLARLCGAIYYSPRRDEMDGLSREATELAQALGDPGAVALAAAARRRAEWGPGRLERRLADSTEVLQAASEAGNFELMLAGNAWLVVDLLERGDRVGVDAQIEAFEVRAEPLRQPLYMWQARIWRAMLALLEGRLDDSGRLAQEALSIGGRQDEVTATQYFAVMTLGLGREQLRSGELVAAAQAMVESNADRSAWRAALVILLCDAGRHEEARRELEPLDEPALRSLTPDLDWTITIALLAEAVVVLGDLRRARVLFELLQPHARSAAVVGAGVLCAGAVAGYLGPLALLLGERERALTLLQDAIELNSSLGAALALAHAQIDYARALGPGEAARAQLSEARASAAAVHAPRIGRRAALVAEQLQI